MNHSNAWLAGACLLTFYTTNRQCLFAHNSGTRMNKNVLLVIKNNVVEEIQQDKKAILLTNIHAHIGIIDRNQATHNLYI